MPRILHVADIHLDSPMRGLERYEGAPAEAMRGATRRAFTQMIDRAIEQRADLVVIAGDLYDGECDDFSTALFLGAQFDRLQQSRIPVCVIRGNHDAASVVTRFLNTPPNVATFASDQPETRLYEDLGLAVHGQSYAQRAVQSNLAERYPKAVPGLFNLGILHTMVDGREGHERYAPSKVDNFRSSGYDYWALGHIHVPEVICTDPLVIMPGNLQGRHAREVGDRGFVWVEYESGKQPSYRVEHVHVARWDVIDVDASDVANLDELIDRTQAALTRTIDGNPAELLAVRLRLVGRTAAHARLATGLERLTAEIRRVASNLSGGCVWVEKVKLATRGAGPAAGDDGPLQTLSQVVEGLRLDLPKLADLARDATHDLVRKLPRDALGAEHAVLIDDPEWLLQLLDRAQHRLELGLLDGQEEAAG